MKRSFAIVVLALLLASAAQAQYFGKNKVRYDSFDWKVYATPHFRISYYDRVEPSLARLASFAESSYDELARKLNFQISEPIPLIAYANHAEFEQTNVIVQFIPEGVGAFATPARNRMVLPVDLPDVELHKLLQHELTHIFQYEILFQGKLGKALTNRPPQWFMEGMASYLADDEDARAQAVMRDATLSDQVPSVEAGVYGYYAYRYGNKVFQFVESEWGIEGVRDLIFEFRNTLGGSIGRAIKRAFDLDVDEFDSRFRTWLRKHYQDVVTAGRGEPREFGRAFRITDDMSSVETSPAASPSGDLVAAFSTHKADVDVVVIGVPDRSLVRNLTRGNTTRYQYLIAQMLTLGPDRGGDLSFSPSGDQVAAIGRKGRGRTLLLLNALKGGIDEEIDLPVDQAMSPAFSPDGKTIAFHAFSGGQADIYLLDLETKRIRNITQDLAYDSAPSFSPDGARLLYTSQAGETSKIVALELADPTRRVQMTSGPGNDEGAALSRDGKRLYFASDRDQGIFDIYGLDLESGKLSRLTNVIGAALNPQPVPTRDGERVIYQAYTKGRWWLYETDPADARDVGTLVPASEPVAETYMPPVTVTVSPEKAEVVKRRKLFLDDVQILVGYNQDQTLLSQTYLSFTDHYGDRRFNLLLESISNYQNFNLAYHNLGQRLQWGVAAFDNRSYFVATDLRQGREVRLKRLYRITGAAAFGQYPISLYHRVDGTIGYFSRDIEYPVRDANGNLAFVQYRDDIPFVETGVTGDTTFWSSYGPHAGRRWNLSVGGYFDAGGGGLLSRDARLDLRQYVPISRRNELAFRLYAAASEGDSANIFYFGGLDTLRGYDYRSLAGNRTAYLNAEWRFPLIDYLAFPWMRLGGLRGRLFLDVGAAWFDVNGDEFVYTENGPRSGFKFMDGSRLQDGVASYGFGFSVNLFGWPVHWDFAKRTDLKNDLDDGLRTTFWIGFRY